MAINKVTMPTPTAPGGSADYVAILGQLEATRNSVASCVPWSGSTIKAGRIFCIGGVLFRADTDTTISGTPSDYVKLTVSGSSATAAFIANLTGVAWNDSYGGYYSGADLVLFDEAKAVYAGAVTTPKTTQGALAYLKLSSLTVTGAISAGNASVAGALQTDTLAVDVMSANQLSTPLLNLATDTVALGNGVTATGSSPVAVGKNATASGFGVAVGRNSYAQDRCYALGDAFLLLAHPQRGPKAAAAYAYIQRRGLSSAYLPCILGGEPGSGASAKMKIGYAHIATTTTRIYDAFDNLLMEWNAGDVTFDSRTAILLNVAT